MSAKLLTAALFFGAVMAVAPIASAQVEPSPMIEESRAPAQEAPAQEPPLPPRRDPTLFGVGVAATITGGVALPVGGMLALVNLLDGVESGIRCAGPGEQGCTSSSDVTGAVGAVLITSGIVLLAAGIPMIVVGGKRLPKDVAFDSVLLRF